MRVPARAQRTRRDWLRTLGGCAAAAAGTGALSGCSHHSARTTSTGAKAVVVWSPIFQAWSGASQVSLKILMSLADRALAGFRSRHPSIEIRNWGPSRGASAVTTALLAGAGPDVFADNSIAPYLEQGLLIDLRPYLRRDNVSETLFATSQLHVFSQGAGLFALPAYVGTVVMLVNEGLLDRLGQRYPAAGWTAAQWATLARSTAGTAKGAGGGHRFGTTFFGAPASFYYHGFGAQVVGPKGTSSGLNSPAAYAAGRWLFDQLHTGVAANLGQQYQANFASGLATTGAFWIQTLPAWVQTLSSMHWNFYPMPNWPVRPATFANSDFWAISAEAKHPDACWELLREVCVGQTYQRTLMKAILFPPALKSLWPDWPRVVRSVAPPLAHKNLEAFAQYVLHDQAYPGGVFRYADPQAWGMYGAAAGQMAAGRVGVRQGLQTAAQQIDALEKQWAGTPSPNLKAEVAARRKAVQRLAGMFAEGG